MNKLLARPFVPSFLSNLAIKQLAPLFCAGQEPEPAHDTKSDDEVVQRKDDDDKKTSEDDVQPAKARQEVPDSSPGKIDDSASGYQVEDASSSSDEASEELVTLGDVPAFTGFFGE